MFPTPDVKDGSKMRAFLGISAATVLLAGLASGCSTAVETACPAAFCAHHGVCEEKSSLPTCACDEGYAGLNCSVCATGFHRAGGSFCFADETCTDGTCGEHGTCSVANGQTSCECANGYTGPACAQCADGFVFVPDTAQEPVDGGLPIGTCVFREQCAETACAPGFACDDATGRVTCTCTNSSCVACETDTCGAHGTCDDLTGFATCTCHPGYTGPGCDLCQLGYSKQDDGSCLLNARCLANSCSGGGRCDASTGALTCDCDDAYTGEFCESCADGHHRDDFGRCVVNATCGPTSCPATATCDDSTGVIRCPCNRGYAGGTCANCYPGFHRGAGNLCVIDEKCTATSCGRGGCEDATGVVVCDCPSGTLGAHCELNPDDCGTACQGGQCIDLVNARQCLCTDGTWGQSCLPGPTISALNPATGDLRGGGTVTVNGTNFEGSSTVTFGGAPASGLVVLSTTQLRFNVPAAAALGRVEIVITNANGQKARGQYTYTPVVFSYTGAAQNFTIPAGVTSVLLQAWGAGGGAGHVDGTTGGAGGFTSGRLSVNAGDVLTVVVGQGGARLGASSRAGAGGGFSGIFLGAASQANARLIAGGGGGAGPVPNAHGGNGGGQFGSDGGAETANTQGLAGSDAAGGIGGCFSDAQCGTNGAALTGGAGGIPNLIATRTGQTYGGGGAVGAAETSVASAGGGGGYFGGGGGSGSAGGGAGGGSGYFAESIVDGESQRSTTAGQALSTDVIGYVAGRSAGGSGATPTGGHGLVLVSW